MRRSLRMEQGQVLRHGGDLLQSRSLVEPEADVEALHRLPRTTLAEIVDRGQHDRHRLLGEYRPTDLRGVGATHVTNLGKFALSQKLYERLLAKGRLEGGADITRRPQRHVERAENSTA